MKDEATFEQICYARIGKQGMGAGYQVINQTPGITKEVADAFAKMQSSYANNVQRMSPDGTRRQVIDLRTEGGHTFLTSAVFGVPDQLGRLALFSHALVSTSDAFQRDPQSLLNVDPSCFKSTVEDSRPEKLDVETGERLSLADALDVAGLDDEGYERLLAHACMALGLVVTQGESKLVEGAHLWKQSVSNPLVAGCSTEAARHALLVLIYEGLPYQLRGLLSTATDIVVRSNQPSITFAERPMGKNVFVPGNSSEAVPVPGFVQQAISCWKQGGERGLGSYFDALEERVARIQDPSVPIAECYEIASLYQGAHPFQQMQGNPFVEQVLALGIPSADEAHAELDIMLSQAIAASMNQGVAYGPKTSDGLDQRASVAADSGFVDTVKTYDAWMIACMPEGGRNDYLWSRYPTAEARMGEEFRELTERLQGMDSSGAEILHSFYKNKVFAHLMGSEALSYDDMEGYWEEVQPLGFDDLTDLVAGQLLPEYMKRHIVPDASPQDFLQAVNPEKRLDDFANRGVLSSSQLKSIWRDAVQAYWHAFTFRTYGFDWKQKHYDLVEAGAVPECQAAKLSASLLSALSGRRANAQTDGMLGTAQSYDQQVMMALESYKDAADQLDADKRSRLNQRLANAAAEPRNHAYGTHLLTWYRFAEAVHAAPNPAIFLINADMIPQKRGDIDALLDGIADQEFAELYQPLARDCKEAAEQDFPEAKRAKALQKCIAARMKRLQKEARHPAPAPRRKEAPLMGDWQSGLPGRDGYGVPQQGQSAGYGDGGTQGRQGEAGPAEPVCQEPRGAAHATAPRSASIQYQAGAHGIPRPKHASPRTGYAAGADRPPARKHADRSGNYSLNDPNGTQAPGMPYQGSTTLHAGRGMTPPDSGRHAEAGKKKSSGFFEKFKKGFGK